MISLGQMKDLPATVPERRRAESLVPDDATRISPEQHDPLGTTPISSPVPTQREIIVPTSATTESIVSEIRKTPYERLEISARAAEGGMGTIDIAVDRALDRRIAIKTLHSHFASDDSAIRMFLREARLTALLDHPHIVPVYDIGLIDRQRLYFGMKLVEGRTLADIIRALPRGALDTATLYALLDVITKVCDALAFAHSRGVLHCDIKPSNVMVGDFGQVYLMDWGIARLAAVEASPASKAKPDAAQRMASATDNSVIGTPCYMSPEQARGDRANLDARSDVFLLGAMIYEVLTRRPPYRAVDRTETLGLASACSFPSPRKVAGEGSVPLELERIVMQAMAKETSERYASVAALRDDIVQFMRGGAEFPRSTFEAGEQILREGETGDAAYIIVSGRCDVTRDTPGGAEVVKTISVGDVFGEMAILSPGPRTANVVATEDTTVLVVTAKSLEQEMAALKPWMATLLKSLASRFRDVDTKNRATFAASPSPARLANQVLMHLTTWGTRDAATGAISMSWSALAPELEAQLGLPPIAVFGAATRYGLVLDLESDRITIQDPKAVAQLLQRDLAG
jgi:serine/threonine-protein kinase